MKQILAITPVLLAVVLAGAARGASTTERMAQVTAPKPQMHTLTPVPMKNVSIDDAFWSSRISLWREKTIGDCFDKFEKVGAFHNFDRVAKGQTGGHEGAPFWDGLAYETITGASDFLAAHPDPALEARIDGYIDRIAAAAAVDPDGFVNTYTTLGTNSHRWGLGVAERGDEDDVQKHDVYNAGCLIEAGAHYYRATGKTKFLAVATRLANTMCRDIGPAPKANVVPGHAIIEQSLAELSQLYKEHPELAGKLSVAGSQSQIAVPVVPNDYLKLSWFFIENRGNHKGRLDYGAYDQDDKPVLQQDAMEGHAVRSELLANGVVKASLISGRSDYAGVLQRWWSNMTEKRMYLTGGLGAVGSYEGFGADYQLPNNGYAETCANIAGGFFSQNMNLAFGDAHYADILERELYNGALSHIALTGDAYYYQNPLSSKDRQREDWAGCPCCPPMFLKMMGALPGDIYATDASGVYVNLFVGGSAKIDTDKLHLTLKQETAYPWKGRVTLHVAPKQPARFRVALRVPDWCEGATFLVNHTKMSPAILRGYALIERTWKAGDTIEMDMPMPARQVKAAPQVLDNAGRVALMRGPIVYCLEGVDNGDDTASMVIPPATQIKDQYEADLLGGVVLLHGSATRVTQKGAGVQTVPANFTAIPFYANSNRKPTAMDVWIADNPATARPETVAGGAVVTASHSNPGDTTAALNDRLEPKASDDETIPRFTWWDHRGGEEWVQYDFPAAQRVSGVDVYWWDETRVHRDCRVPQSWTVQYLDNGQWKPVSNSSPYGTQVDRFNHVAFAPVNTTALRITVQQQTGWSGGILEWRVQEQEEPTK
jgi:DUF1680 family protein